MSHTLYSTDSTHVLSFPAKIAAAMGKTDLVQVYPDAEMKETAEFKAKKAHGKFPMLETPEGDVVFESNAIALYFAKKAGIAGSNAFESAQIEQFMHIHSGMISSSVVPLMYTILGVRSDLTKYAAGLKAFRASLALFEGHLAGKEYFVGGKLSVADLVVFVAVNVGFGLVIDEEERTNYPGLVAWWTRISSVEEVKAVFGAVKMCKYAMHPEDFEDIGEHTLYSTDSTHLLSFASRVLADFAGVPLNVVYPSAEVKESKAFKAKKAHGKFPMLETESGDVVFESNAIASYFARHANMAGSNAFETAQVEQWLDINGSSTLKGAVGMFYTLLGHRNDLKVYGESLKAYKKSMADLDAALKGKNYLVGNKLTAADLVCYYTASIGFALVLDETVRKTMPNLTKWFNTIKELPQVIAVSGHAKACAVAMHPEGFVEEEAAPAVEAKEDDEFDPFAEDEEEDAAAAAALKAKAQAAKDAKPKKVVIAKSIILWEVKPWGEETDLDVLAATILAFDIEGVWWKTQYKKEPIAYGLFKLIIGATVEDDKVSTDDVQERIEALEDLVQSVDILSFNKV